MRSRGAGLLALSAVAVLVAACSPGADTTTTAVPTTPAPASTTTTTAPADPGFYLNLVWHQHQPFYPKDAAGVYTRPWVRVHATKDYWDMADMVGRYPGLHVTFNLTPVLLLQLEDLANGAKDAYSVAAEAPAAQLTEDAKRFLVERFFDVNPSIVARFPRFQELADARAASGIEAAVAEWSTADFLDLQVLFNLAWTDPGFLEQAPLAELVAKGRGFAEADKAIVFAEHLRIIQDVVDLHARLWDEGTIEVTTTPLAHPILPLVADTDLAVVGDPTAVLPSDRFRFLQDGAEHVTRGLDEAERLLGRRPSGMWPGEGSVAQLVMGLFSQNGVGWVATGEEVLAKTLGVGSFIRDATDLVDHPELLYRPWAAQTSDGQVPMFFRDGVLSDLVGFEYSGTPADQAADDFMGRLRAIRDSLDAQGIVGGVAPPVVSVILDGENAWENYPNDGKDFLDALYSRLSGADWVGTITPSEYLARYQAPEALGDVWPGAWFQPNFATWIGEDEEATAWEYLYDLRQDYRRAEASGTVGEDALATAFETMLFAEGSDWFWWYGADQDSGNDAYFDAAFRELLGQVYDALGMERPGFVAVPIIPAAPVAADVTPSGLLTMAIDGDSADWDGAGEYRVFDELAYRWGFDTDSLYLGRFTDPGDPYPLVVYLGAPTGSGDPVGLAGEILGFGARGTLVWDGEDGCLFEGVPSAEAAAAADDCIDLEAAPLRTEFGDGGFEAAIPLSELGALQSGDVVLARASDAGVLQPEAGPMAFQVPDISDVDVFLDVEDPAGDDHGPGTYTYPTDPVFIAGSYDLTRFTAGTEGDDLVLSFEVGAPILNPWGSPRSLSVQTFDVYIDTDPGAGTGARVLIPGRNGALEAGSGWEYGITVEGWDPAVYVASADGAVEETKPTFDILTFGDDAKVVVRIPVDLLGGGDPTTWGYAAVVLSQEGFPSPGVRRVRNVDAFAAQWVLGGGPGDVNHTRIIDVAWPEAHEVLLGAYPPATSGSVDDLGPDDFGRVPLLVP